MTGRRPTPKYQVFVSSTYEDLRSERESITWEILKANHIPVGMENFPASDDRGWKTIQRAIDRSDYYVVIVAGLYGSIDPETGISWTQREYEYAHSKGVPVLAFLRDEATILAKVSEKDGDRAKLLAAFKEKLNNHHRKVWKELGDLRVEVVHALRAQIDADEEGQSPRPGWYRGDEIPTGMAVDEFARLSAENADLREKFSAMGAAKEKLVLLRENGIPPVDQSYEVPAYTLEKAAASQHPYDRVMPDRGTASQEALDYVRDLSLVHWVRLKLKNDGAKPAKRIVARFSSNNATGVVVHSLERPRGALAAITARNFSEPFYRRPTEHVYVSDTRHTAPVRVEQRIQQVGVGGTESFIAMGFRGRIPHVGVFTFTVGIDYEIRSEDGSLVEGSFTETIQVGADHKVLKRNQVYI